MIFSLLLYVHHILIQFPELKIVKNGVLHVGLEEVLHVVEVLLNYEVNLHTTGHANVDKLHRINAWCVCPILVRVYFNILSMSAC